MEFFLQVMKGVSDDFFAPIFVRKLARQVISFDAKRRQAFTLNFILRQKPKRDSNLNSIYRRHAEVGAFGSMRNRWVLPCGLESFAYWRYWTAVFDTECDLDISLLWDDATGDFDDGLDCFGF